MCNQVTVITGLNLVQNNAVVIITSHLSFAPFFSPFIYFIFLVLNTHFLRQFSFLALISYACKQCQEQRGAANGISVTAMSLFKAAAPAGGGAL